MPCGKVVGSSLRITTFSLAVVTLQPHFFFAASRPRFRLATRCTLSASFLTALAFLAACIAFAAFSCRDDNGRWVVGGGL